MVCPDGLSEGWDFQLPTGWQVPFFCNNFTAQPYLPQSLFERIWHSRGIGGREGG